jgi:hypothetical protein
MRAHESAGFVGVVTAECGKQRAVLTNGVLNVFGGSAADQSRELNSRVETLHDFGDIGVAAALGNLAVELTVDFKCAGQIVLLGALETCVR